MRLMPRRSTTKSTDATAEPERRKGVNVPINLPTELDEEITQTAERLGLKKQAVMRLSLARGLKVLVDQLEPDAART
jgi:hypothetical protein